MNRGYVKLWRKTLDSGVMDDPDTLHLFIWLLLNATRKPRQSVVKGAVIEQQPGDAIIAFRKTSALLGATRRNFRTSLSKLEKLQIVTRKATRYCTVVSLTNWHTYQCLESETDTPDDTETTRERHASDTQTTQEQEVKKVRSKKSIFQKPTIEEVAAYCAERNRGVNPQKWYDHYEAKGWKIGSAKMKNWKAAVRTWESDIKPEEPKKLELAF